jgi:hypothetical protein
MKKSNHYPEGMDHYGFTYQACKDLYSPFDRCLIADKYISPISTLGQTYLDHLRLQGWLPYIQFEDIIMYRLLDMQAFWYAIFGDYPQVWHHLYRSLMGPNSGRSVDSAGSYYYESYRKELFPCYGKTGSSENPDSSESLRLARIKAYLEAIGLDFGKQFSIHTSEDVDVTKWWKHGRWHLDF